jgi:hypothetical protein
VIVNSLSVGGVSLGRAECLPLYANGAVTPGGCARLARNDAKPVDDDAKRAADRRQGDPQQREAGNDDARSA